jgi:hypothetical protein
MNLTFRYIDNVLSINNPNFDNCINRIQYISHQYQDLLYCNTSQYILSTYNSQHNNNNNVVLAMTMPK